jgi:hypothetical protein
MYPLLQSLLQHLSQTPFHLPHVHLARHISAAITSCNN